VCGIFEGDVVHDEVAGTIGLDEAWSVREGGDVGATINGAGAVDADVRTGNVDELTL